MSAGSTPPSSGAPQPPGWHPDPQHPNSWRYWDGATWTDQRAPMQAPSRARVAASNQASDGLVIAGYLLALLPFLGWFVAFIIGIILLAKDRVGHGLGVITLTILSPLIWFTVIVGAGS